jgi:hypothetical protein
MGGKSFPGPWTFKYHPWLKEMHDSRAISNVGQKSAQMGYTETVLNVTFFKIDIERTDCLYILPAKTPDASDFSASRFDPALELSPHLQKMFSEVKNVGHKRAGATNLYIRGSKSRSGLKSIPAGFIVFDELAEMDQENIPLAMERAAGQIEKQDWKISTPTIEDANINVFFKESTQEHFFFACPHCSKQVELTFPDNLVITATKLDDPQIEESHIICNECKSTLDHGDKVNFLQDGVWVPQKRSSTRGFYINQLYSPAVKPPDLARKYIKSLSDPTAEQEFYNSNLGQPHVVKGAQVLDDDINRCIADYRSIENRKITRKDVLITMGIDVGRWLHTMIEEWSWPNGVPISDLNLYARPRVLWYGKTPHFRDLDRFMDDFGIKFAVIDANPERREAHSFASRHYGKVRMCIYARSQAARQIVPSPDVDMAVNVDRTSWLDLSLGRFRRGQEGILLPNDIDQEFRDNIKAQVRQYKKDKDGNPIGVYVTPENKADHYGHARNYSEIAFALAFGRGSSKNMESPV